MKPRPPPAQRRPPEGLRERNKRAKEARLRDAASALFRARGFEGTTIRDVAERAALGVGTVYAYVSDKTALLELISRDDLARTEERAFATLPTSDLHAQLRHVFRCIYEHHAQDPELARVIIKELAFARDATAPERAARFGAFLLRLAGLVDAARARGEVSATLDSTLVVQAVFGLHFALLITWLAGGLPEPLPAFEQQLALLFRGLRPEPPSDASTDPAPRGRSGGSRTANRAPRSRP